MEESLTEAEVLIEEALTVVAASTAGGTLASAGTVILTAALAVERTCRLATLAEGT